jgi:hypothetical protein
MSLMFPVDAKLKDGSPVQLVLADERDVEPLRRLYRVIVDEGNSYPRDRFPDQGDFMDYSPSPRLRRVAASARRPKALADGSENFAGYPAACCGELHWFHGKSTVAAYVPDRAGAAGMVGAFYLKSEPEKGSGIFS